MGVQRTGWDVVMSWPSNS